MPDEKYPTPAGVDQFEGRAAEQIIPHPITPTRRRTERIQHPELLTPIELPAMREPQVIISMDEYRAYERFVQVFSTVENYCRRGRLEGSIEAYDIVLEQVRVREALSAVRQPELITKLEEVLAAYRAQLAVFEAEGKIERATAPSGTSVSVDRAIDTDTIVGVVHLRRAELREATAYRVRDLVHEAVELLREALLEHLQPQPAAPTP